MKTNINKKSPKLFDFVAMAALTVAVLILSGCPGANSAGRSGGNTGSGGGQVTPPTPASKSKYTVTFSVGDANGSLKAMVGSTEIHSGDKVEQGKTVTFTATANKDYEVKEWTNNGAPIAAAGTNKTYTHTVTAAANIKVSFTEDKTYTVGGVSFTMKKIASVTGKSIGHTDQVRNKPHSVSLSAYLIGETEVTQALWKAVMGTNPSHFKDSIKNPVEKVNWYDCIVFCNELTKKVYGTKECIYTVEGHTYGTADATADKTPVMDMSKKGFRLPTEAEWEWAAMGGTEHQWAGTSTEGELKDYAWYNANSNYKTHEVKLKSANGYGLYDTSGNVWEWYWDWNNGTTPADGQMDPTGLASGVNRVRRGGSWIDGAGDAARAYRHMYPPNGASFSLGLRLVSRP